MFDNQKNLKYDTHEHHSRRNTDTIVNKRIMRKLYGANHEHMGANHEHMGANHEHMGANHEHMGANHEHFENCNQSYGNLMGCGGKHNQSAHGNLMGCGGKHDQNKHLMNSCNQAAHGNHMDSCLQGFEQPMAYDSHPEQYREPL